MIRKMRKKKEKVIRDENKWRENNRKNIDRKKMIEENNMRGNNMNDNYRENEE